MILLDSLLFTPEQIKKIEELRSATYVCETEHKNVLVDVFYGSTEHPVYKSRYFGLYKSDDGLMITDGSFVEDIKFTGVKADNGDIIYSRHRHDMRQSPDGSVWIDGGNDYVRSGLYTPDKYVTLVVKQGVLSVV